VKNYLCRKIFAIPSPGSPCLGVPVLLLGVIGLIPAWPSPALGEEVNTYMAQVVQERARQALQALVDEKPEELLKYTYEGLMKTEFGGRENMRKKLKASMSMARRPASFRPMGFEVTMPDTVVEAGTELHMVVPYTLYLQNEVNRATVKSFLLAIKGQDDSVVDWKFLDGYGLSDLAFQMILPHFNQALELPDVEEPVVEPLESERAKDAADGKQLHNRLEKEEEQRQEDEEPAADPAPESKAAF
jgi:hypothetical protein